MATHTETAVNDLQRTALEKLWVYLREPSDMAEKGEPQIFVEGKGWPGHRRDGQHLHRRHVGPVAEKRRVWAEGNRRRRVRADA